MNPGYSTAVSLVSLALIASSLPAVQEANAYVWVEGEEASSVDGIRAHEFEPRDEKEAQVLSGGDWLCIRGTTEPGSSRAAYDFDVPRAGPYRLVMRKFWKHGRFRWRIGDGSWQDYDRQGPLLDSVAIRDKLCVNWVPLGSVDLDEGRQRLEIETTGTGPVCIDCFILTPDPFLPRGKARPDEPWAEPEPGMWVFDPRPDSFSEDALLDLRDLNEDTAGQAGYVGLDRTGNGFVDGAGRPLRFWCMTGIGTSDPDRYARFLAKRGVNLIQILGGYIGNGCYRSESGDLHDINTGYQQRIWRAVAANRKYGLYTTFSCLGALGYGAHLPDSWGLSPDGSKWATRGAWFWDPRLREAYKQWLRKFFTAVNPHTGLPLARDPSIAFVQLMAEDGMFFWTSTRIEGAQRRMLERIFGDWLKEKYGSLDQALTAWGGRAHKDDAPDEGRMGLYDMYHLATESAPEERSRLADQTEFFARTQRSFYDEMRRYCREELGMRHLFMSGVWRTANDHRMLDLERWTYAGMDVAGKSHFFSSPHQVPPGRANTAGYQINPGDFVQPRSCFKEPTNMPFAQKRPLGQPFMNHQCLWNPASPWLSESVLVMSAWGAATGLDVTGWFAHSTVEFGSTLRRWGAGSPDVLGGFPAAALAFRRGDVPEATPAAIERRPFEELRHRRPAWIAEGTGFDPTQDRHAETEFAGGGRVDPLAYLTGPVQVEFTKRSGESAVDPDLPKLIDRERGIIRSNTGELTWNLKRGYGKADTPHFKAVSGFLKEAGGSFDLDGLRIESQNEYATVMVVSMDGRPIRSAERVLLQVTTTARPTGWRTRPTEFAYRRRKDQETLTGYEIVSTGRAPWQIARADVRIVLRNPGLTRAQRLDTNGMAVSPVDLDRTGEEIMVRFPPDALYVVLTSSAR